MADDQIQINQDESVILDDSEPSDIGRTVETDPSSHIKQPEWHDTFEGREQLAHVETLMESQARQFGQVSKKIFPFTKQLLNEIRQAYPIDMDVYEKVDESFKNVKSLGRSLAWLDFGLGLVLFSFVTVLLMPVLIVITGGSIPDSASVCLAPVAFDWAPCTSVNLIEVKNAIEPLNTLKYIIYLVLPALTSMLVFVPFRNFCRNQSKEKMNTNATTLMRLFEKRTSEIDSSVHDNCTQIQYARSMDNWPKRAHAWSLIAQWNTRRAEYIDRYYSTIRWKQEWYFSVIENVQFCARIFFSLAVFTTLFTATHFLSGSNVFSSFLLSLVIAVIIFVYQYWVWFLPSRVSNEYWGKEAAGSDESNKETSSHVYSHLAREVEILVKTIMDNQRRSGP